MKAWIIQNDNHNEIGKIIYTNYSIMVEKKIFFGYITRKKILCHERGDLEGAKKYFSNKSEAEAYLQDFINCINQKKVTNKYTRTIIDIYNL